MHGGRLVLAVGRLVLLAGVLLVALSLAVDSAARQEVAGIGLATVMGGLMIVLLGNYLRHAAERDAPAGGAARGADGSADDHPDHAS